MTFASGYTFGSDLVLDAVVYLLVLLDAIVYLVVVLPADSLPCNDILTACKTPIASAGDACTKVNGKANGCTSICFVCGLLPFLAFNSTIFRQRFPGGGPPFSQARLPLTNNGDIPSSSPVHPGEWSGLDIMSPMNKERVPDLDICASRKVV